MDEGPYLMEKTFVFNEQKGQLHGQGHIEWTKRPFKRTKGPFMNA